jgi:hypothetical protein
MMVRDFYSGLLIILLLFLGSSPVFAFFSPWDCSDTSSHKQDIITSLPEIAGISVIRFYQTTISPQLRPNKCNFTPSCSNYALQAINKYGGVSGMVMAFERLSRDHPWAWEEGYAVKNGRLVDEP